jgi:hypothetical protein
MSNSTELVFDFGLNGKPSGTTVTARIGDDVLACDRFDVAKSKSRGNFLDSLCKQRPGINRAEAERVLLAHVAENVTQHNKTDETSAQPDTQELLLKMPEHVRKEAQAMLESPDLMKRVIDDVAACGVAGERELTASIYLVGLSRLLPRPLAAIVQAPSSTGKSYVVDKSTAMFPPEAVIQATAMTAQSLYYLEPGALQHKFIVAGERSRKEDDDTAEATRALREMISSGRLSKLVPMKEDGRYVTHRIEQPGPIAYIETTTLSRIFDEDANRCLLLAADERQGQTAAIVNRLAEAYSGAAGTNVDSIIARHHAAQRILQQRQVVIPFAGQIADLFDKQRVEARRAFPHLMGMIQAATLLHQFQRQIDTDGCIVASVDDYQLARRLCGGPLARMLSGRISDAAIRFYDRLSSWASGVFTSTEAVKRERASDRAVRGWLQELAGAGALEQVDEARGSRPASWKLTGMDRAELMMGDCGLPEPESIKNE